MRTKCYDLEKFDQTLKKRFNFQLSNTNIILKVHFEVFIT